MPTYQRRDCRCTRVQHVHGTRAAFDTDQCRCFPCRLAYSQARAALRRGGTTAEVDWQPTIGTQRRMQALFALGWNWSTLGAHLGVTTEAARQAALASGRSRCHPTTVARVRALYDQLSLTRPEGRDAQRARTLAARKGWLPPLAWDDDEIDHPDAMPHQPPAGGPRELTPCGTSSAARRHWRRGEPLDEACRAAAAREKNERAARRRTAA